MHSYEQQGKKKTTHVRELDGVDELIGFMQHAREQEYISGLAGASLYDESGEYKPWSGSRTMEEAIEVARFGWEEGCKYLQQRIGEIAVDQLIGDRTVVNQRYQLAGDEVDIDRYLIGEPEQMIEYYTEPERNGKHVTILANIGVPATVQPQQIMRRGGAMYAAMEALRSSGYSTGLSVATAVKTKHDRIEYHVPIVQPGEYLNIDTAAFCLAHPSFLRRGIFAAGEHEPVDLRERMNFIDGRGYGSPSKIKTELPPSTVLIDKEEGLDLETPVEVQRFAQHIIDRALQAISSEDLPSLS